MARKRRDEARTQLADGIDPSHKRKAEKLSNANTFRAIAEEWLALQKDKLHVRTFDKAKYQLESLASTLLNEQGWHPDLIELQLAHAERNKVRAAYNRAQRLPERRKMMQAWADYLEALRNDDAGNVVNIRAA